MRRLLASAGLFLVLAASVSSVARAQEGNGYSGGWTDPTPSETNDNGQPLAYIDAMRTLTGQVSHTNGIERVSAVLVPDPNNPPPEGCGPSMSPVTVEQDGTTVTFRVDPTFPCNLVYQVKATAQARSSGPVGAKPPAYQMPLAIAVAVPPAPVGTLTATASADGDKRAVKLEWPANTEPDLLGYVVKRTVRGTTADLGQVAAGDPLEWVDHNPGSGVSNRYEVIAVRRGPDAKIEQVAALPTSVDVAVQSRSSGGGASSSGGSGSGLTTVVTGRPVTGKPDSGVLSSVRARGGNGAPSGGPPTTFDTGFQGTLPFKTGDQSASAAPDGSDDPAVVAAFDDGGNSSLFGSKAAMTFIAGGLAVLVGAAVLFYVSRRASADAY